MIDHTLKYSQYSPDGVVRLNYL